MLEQLGPPVTPIRNGRAIPHQLTREGMAMTIVEGARGITGSVDTHLEVHVAAALALPDELEEGLVDLVGMCPAHVVGSALDLYKINVLDELGDTTARRVDGQDTVLGALDDE